MGGILKGLLDKLGKSWFAELLFWLVLVYLARIIWKP